MLEYLSKADKPTAIEKEIEEAVSTTPLTDELAQKGAPVNEQLQNDMDFVKEQTAALRDGTFNDSYRRMASGFGPAAGTSASDALQAQINQGIGNIDVNEFAKKSALNRMSLENDFARSMGDNIFETGIFRS